MKDQVTKFNLEAAFKALNEIEIPQVGGVKPNKDNHKELVESMRPTPKTDCLLEDYYKVNNQEDLGQAQADRAEEVAQAKLAKIEKIVDLDAETPEDVQPSYVGKTIVQCPQCMTLFYRDLADINVSEEDQTLVNVGEKCPNCNNDSGYTVIGKVAAEEPVAEPIPVEENELDLNFEEPANEKAPVEEPVGGEAPTEETSEEEPTLEPVEEPAEENKEEEKPEEEEEKKEESFEPHSENILAEQVENALKEDVDELTKKLKEHDEYIKVLQDEIKAEEEAVKNAKNDFIKKMHENNLASLKDALDKAIPEEVKAEAAIEELPTAEDAAEDMTKNEALKEEEEKFPDLEKHEEVGEVDGIKIYHCKNCGKFGAKINDKVVKKDSKEEIENCIKGECKESLKEEFADEELIDVSKEIKAIMDHHGGKLDAMMTARCNKIIGDKFYADADNAKFIKAAAKPFLKEEKCEICGKNVEDPCKSEEEAKDCENKPLVEGTATDLAVELGKQPGFDKLKSQSLKKIIDLYKTDMAGSDQKIKNAKVEDIVDWVGDFDQFIFDFADDLDMFLARDLAKACPKLVKLCRKLNDEVTTAEIEPVSDEEAVDYVFEYDHDLPVEKRMTVRRVVDGIKDAYDKLNEDLIAKDAPEKADDLEQEQRKVSEIHKGKKEHVPGSIVEESLTESSSVEAELNRFAANLGEDCKNDNLKEDAAENKEKLADFEQEIKNEQLQEDGEKCDIALMKEINKPMSFNELINDPTFKKFGEGLDENNLDEDLPANVIAAGETAVAELKKLNAEAEAEIAAAEDEKDNEEIEPSELYDSYINSTVTNYLTEVYSNVENFEATECLMLDEKLIIEGNIKFKSGKTKATKFEFTKTAKNIYEGINKDLAGDDKFILECFTENGGKTLMVEKLTYKYHIGKTLIEGLAKVSE